MTPAETQLIGPFKVIKRPELGSPGCARHRITYEEVLIKTGWLSSLATEAHTLHAAGGGIGIPQLHWYETIDGKDVIVMENHGQYLEEIFCQSGRYFSMQTLLLFADQLLSRVEFIHSRNIIHGNLNPWTFALGRSGWQSQQVFLVDFNIESGPEATVRNDLLAVGDILSYFYNGMDSWDQYQRKTQKERTAPVFATFLHTVSSQESIDYGMLRDIFRDAYQDFALNLAVALDLTGPRAIANGMSPYMGELSAMNTADLFNSLRLKLSQTGQRISLLQGRTYLLESLEEILKIYMVLLIRDRPSCEKREPVIGAYQLPNQLWRDLLWLINSSSSSDIASVFYLAIVGAVYRFITVLYETAPAYRIYWTGYLLELARIRRDVEPSCEKVAWTQTVFYWQEKVNQIKMQRD